MELQHGFTSREEWTDFFTTHFQRLEVIEEAVFSLSEQAEDFDEWYSRYQSRSKDIRKMYLQNDLFLNRHIYYFLTKENAWSIEAADPLLACLFRNCTRFDDVEIAFRLSASLLNFYKGLADEIAQMKCYMIQVTCYAFLDELHFRKDICRLCTCGEALYEKHYDELSEEEKSMGLSLYDFDSINQLEFINKEADIEHAFEQVLYPAFLHRMKIIDRFMQNTDLRLEYNAAVPYMRQSWISAFSSAILQVKKGQLQEKQLQLLHAVAAKQLEEETSEAAVTRKIINETVLLVGEYQMGKRSSEEIYEYLLSAVELLPKNKSTSEKTFELERMDALTVLARSLDILDRKQEDKKECANRLITAFSDLISSLPSSTYLEYVVDVSICNYIIPLLKYCGSTEAMFFNLLHFTIFRQVQTAIHSIMVSMLSCRILESILLEQPQLLVTFYGMESVEEVAAKAKQLMEYTQKAALLHDVGKILCTNVINVQYRNLIDLEFQTIQFHPRSGAEILNEIPALSCYQDVAAGHHKSWDDTFGYPCDFHKQSSEYGLFIDLITLADCMDTATDTLGRVYAEPKDLTAVLQEFKEESGTRYAPALVDYLSSSLVLQTVLEKELLEGRDKACRMVYQLLKTKREDSDSVFQMDTLFQMNTAVL